MNWLRFHKGSFLIVLVPLLLGGCFGRSGLKVGSHEEGEVVIAEGFAPYDSSDLLKTKRESLTAAQRTAVEKVVGVFVSAKTMVERSQMIENNILSQTEGWVKTYEIMDEGPSEGNLYRTKIKALVALRDLETALKDMSLLDKPELQRPRLYVQLDEKVKNQTLDDNPATRALENALMEDGYKIVSSDQMKDADLQVQGTASAFPFQAEGLGGFVSYRARLSVKVVRTGTKNIVVSHSKEASGLGGSSELAGLKALETVGSVGGAELAEKLTQAWGKGNNVLVFVEGVKDFAQVDRVKKHIGAQPEVQDLVLRLFDEGMAQYEVLLGNMQTSELASRLEKSKTVPMKVLEIQPQNLRLKLE
jgi:hypothetical protein